MRALVPTFILGFALLGCQQTNPASAKGAAGAAAGAEPVTAPPAADAKVRQITSPRDPASGQATGRRTYKP